MLETLCFHAQQAVEKSLKALLISHSRSFPRTHNISILLDLTPSEVEIPDFVKRSAILTDYSVESRYPGDFEPVSKEEYEEAINIAENVFQ